MRFFSKCCVRGTYRKAALNTVVRFAWSQMPIVNGRVLTYPSTATFREESSVRARERTGPQVHGPASARARKCGHGHAGRTVEAAASGRRAKRFRHPFRYAIIDFAGFFVRATRLIEIEATADVAVVVESLERACDRADLSALPWSRLEPALFTRLEVASEIRERCRGGNAAYWRRACSRRFRGRFVGFSFENASFAVSLYTGA